MDECADIVTRLGIKYAKTQDINAITILDEFYAQLSDKECKELIKDNPLLLIDFMKFKNFDGTKNSLLDKLLNNGLDKNFLDGKGQNALYYLIIRHPLNIPAFQMLLTTKKQPQNYQGLLTAIIKFQLDYLPYLLDVWKDKSALSYWVAFFGNIPSKSPRDQTVERVIKTALDKFELEMLYGNKTFKDEVKKSL